MSALQSLENDPTDKEEFREIVIARTLRSLRPVAWRLSCNGSQGTLVYLEIKKKQTHMQSRDLNRNKSHTETTYKTVKQIIRSDRLQ